MPILDTSLVVPALCALSTALLNPKGAISPQTVLGLALVLSIMDFWRYFILCSWDMREALDVYIFSLKYPKSHPKNRAGVNGFYVHGLNNSEVKKSWKQFKNESEHMFSTWFAIE
jgi:hypothetical protein